MLLGWREAVWVAGSRLARRAVVGMPSWPLHSLALSGEVGPPGLWAALAKGRAGPEPAALGQRGLEAWPYFQRLPCPRSEGGSLPRILAPGGASCRP